MVRDKGSGSIYQIQDGRWQASIEAGYTKSGGRKRVKITRATRKEVELEFKKRRRDLIETGPTDVGSRTTVKAWADEWIEIQRTRVRPSTFEGYRTAVGWIVEAIGDRRVADLTPGHVRTVTKLVLTGRKGRENNSTTAALIHTNLVKMLKDAKREGHAVPARVFDVEKPSKAPNTKGEIPIEHVISLLRAAADRPDASRWLAAFHLGLRQGEALGLLWEHVHIDRGYLEVRWQLDSLHYRDRAAGILDVPHGLEVRQLHGTLCLVPPKTSKGFRLIPLTPTLNDALTVLPRTHELVWPALRPNASGVLEYLPQTDAGDITAWRSLQDKAGVRHTTRVNEDGSPSYYTIHEIRHSTATVLMAAGVDESVRIAILGHSSIATTRGYQHANIEMLRTALATVDQRMRQLPGG